MWVFKLCRFYNSGFVFSMEYCLFSSFCLTVCVHFFVSVLHIASYFSRLKVFIVSFSHLLTFSLISIYSMYAFLAGSNENMYYFPPLTATLPLPSSSHLPLLALPTAPHSSWPCLRAWCLALRIVKCCHRAIDFWHQRLIWRRWRRRCRWWRGRKW